MRVFGLVFLNINALESCIQVKSLGIELFRYNSLQGNQENGTSDD